MTTHCHFKYVVFFFYLNDSERIPFLNIIPSFTTFFLIFDHTHSSFSSNMHRVYNICPGELTTIRKKNITSLINASSSYTIWAHTKHDKVVCFANTYFCLSRSTSSVHRCAFVHCMVSDMDIIYAVCMRGWKVIHH